MSRWEDTDALDARVARMYQDPLNWQNPVDGLPVVTEDVIRWVLKDTSFIAITEEARIVVLALAERHPA